MAKVGIEPTSPAFQASANTSSATWPWYTHLRVWTWGDRRESNPRLSGSQPDDQPLAVTVRERGLEPPTSWIRTTPSAADLLPGANEGIRTLTGLLTMQVPDRWATLACVPVLPRLWMPAVPSAATCRVSPQDFVGVTGFEPATFWSRTRRSSQAELHPEIGPWPRTRTLPPLACRDAIPCLSRTGQQLQTGLMRQRTRHGFISRLRLETVVQRMQPTHRGSSGRDDVPSESSLRCSAPRLARKQRACHPTR